MSNVSVLKRFQDISIAKKLYFTVGIMAVLIAIELFTLFFAINTLSSVRAFVAGEGLWSKGEKDAVYHLEQYGHSHNERDYLNFQKFMQVPLGDRKTLVQLLKKNPDLDATRHGFIEGRNHPKDVDGMIKLFTRFHSVYYIHKAIVIWIQADSGIGPLIPIGEKLHQEITSASPSQEKIDRLLQQINDINENLTSLEDDFSFTLGEGSRWLENLVLGLLFSVALTVEISGLLLTISVSRGIQKGLGEIIRASNEIAEGDLKARARAYSNDEIGTLANSFNKMTEELEINIAERKKVEESLKENTRRLEQSNNSLEEFAYVASHDLQEPLRTITNFVRLLEEKEKANLDGASRRYMSLVVNAANRMRGLIRDMLHFSRLGKHSAGEQVDCNAVVVDVLMDLNLLIKETKAKITVGDLPVIKSNKTEIQQLFQNLINNAIKYRKTDVAPEVEVNAVKNGKANWLFSITDNGIGIDPEYGEKIFVIFQRLHNQNEYSGTGIGLATCKKIVELNGGKIWVESKQNEGSTFYFTLPKK